MWLVCSPSQPSVGTEIPSTSEDGEGDNIELPSCDDGYSLLFVATVFAVAHTFGVGGVICSNPFKEGLVNLASGRFRTEIAGYAIGRNIRDPLHLDVTLGSDGGGSTQFDSDGDEMWRHSVVVGIPPGNAVGPLTSQIN